MNADEFNRLYPVGTPVFAYPGARPEDIPSARRLVTRTRTAAQVSCSGHAVVWIEGEGAYICLTHVDPVSESVYEAALTVEAVRAADALPVPVGPEPQPLSPERLAEIAARADAATPGPWCTDAWEIYEGAEFMPGISERIGDTCRGTVSVEGLAQDRADAAFVAAARTDVPALMAEIGRLRKYADQAVQKYVRDLGAYQLTGELYREHIAKLKHRLACLEAAAIAGRAVLAAFCHDLEDPGTAALGALYLLQQATPGTPMERGETVPKVYRASHDSIVMGLYLTATEARKHCETEMRRDLPTVVLDWIEDEEDGVAELVASVGEDERATGYVVDALEIASEYDEEADE